LQLTIIKQVKIFSGGKMKIKFLAVLGLAAVAGLGGCKSAANTNVANMTTNGSNMAVNTMTPMTTMTPSAATNPALKSSIETALRSKGFNDITVDTSTTPATLRGSYPKGRVAEVIQTAQVANGGKPVQNQAVEGN
jgi:osmotically-inducible protein OsmY